GRGGGGGGAGGAVAVAGSLAPPAPVCPYVSDTLEVVVANQSQRLLVPLKGRVWGEGAFLAGPSYPPAAPDAPATAAVALPPAAILQKGAQPPASPASQLPPRQLLLRLPGPVAPGQASVAAMEFGSIKGSGGSGAPAEVVWEELPAAAKAAGWSVVEPLKQSAPPGERRAVTVRFAPPAAAAPVPAAPAGAGAPAVGGGGAGVGALLGLPEAVECMLRCTLRGGLPAAGSVECAAGSAEGDVRRLEVRCVCVVAPPPPATGASSMSPHIASVAAAAPLAATQTPGKPRV
ncbi:hypothetical protein MNEG_8241, partial [Monoraphidium neglectum]